MLSLFTPLDFQCSWNGYWRLFVPMRACALVSLSRLTTVTACSYYQDMSRGHDYCNAWHRANVLVMAAPEIVRVVWLLSWSTSRSPSPGLFLGSVIVDLSRPVPEPVARLAPQHGTEPTGCGASLGRTHGRSIRGAERQWGTSLSARVRQFNGFFFPTGNKPGLPEFCYSVDRA